ncbi:MAG: response regulator transcription factor [Proteobacteria bacterium]|nr:response regulator transcription factor [Pseudomonadota bacterium]
MSALKQKIILVDDHEVVRSGLSAIIGAEADLEVIDQFSNAASALECIVATGPDFVVIDVNMPGLSPFEMTVSARRVLPTLKVIFLSAFGTDTNLQRALTSGASGFVSKSEAVTTIVTAIRTLTEADGPFISEDLKERIKSYPQLIPGTSDKKFDRPSLRVKKSLLSPREYEILCSVAQGQSAKQIASILSISAKTVERHKSNIMTKLHLHTQVDLTRFAIREGIISA